MSTAIYLTAYGAVGVFLVVVVARFFYWVKMPMHVRWELYPVAHEAKRAHYGGSYLEETEWWKKPRESSLLGELKVMIPEILFLVALKEHNKKLWTRSFPFHFGLYLIIAATAAMAAFGLFAAIWPNAAGGVLGDIAHWSIMICGYGGLGLGLLGAFGLLMRRLTDPDLKDFTAPADIFNLVFFLVAFGFSAVTVLAVDREFVTLTMIWHQLVSFGFKDLPVTGASLVLPMISVILMAALMVYIPLTHMSHFIGKYFAYHAIRWNDTPNLGEAKREAQIAGVLSYPVSWAAPHIRADGKKNWVDIALDIPTQEKKS